MSDITIRTDILAEPIGGFGGDWLVADAARVSATQAEGRGERVATERDKNLITDLVKLRHGGPFQHGALTFYVEVPIFVAREWRTHKILMHQTTDDMGYSEASARYRPLRGEFWMPGPDRPIQKTHGYKAMRPSAVVADREVYNLMTADLHTAYQAAWYAYENILALDILPEVARACLPVATYTAMYVTCNPRSLMHFCSLRVNSVDSAVPTYPQLEIEFAAKALERVFQAGWPVTWRAWVDNGRSSI